jgi:hypothetical protein
MTIERSDEIEGKKVLAHEGLPVFKKVLVLVTAIGTIYLAVIFFVTL